MEQAGRKPTLIVHESLVLSGLVPADLFSDRVDLRSVRALQEAVSLAQTTPLHLVVLDLSAGAENVGDILPSLKPCPALGILPRKSGQDLSSWFSTGINSVLLSPFATGDLQDEIEALLGLKFRRSERKPLQLPVEMSASNSTWQGKAVVINDECIAVVGDFLPPLGSNVWLQSPDENFTALKTWAYCWNKGKKGELLLRFLNPPDALLHSIESLASAPIPQAAPATVKTELNAEDPLAPATTFLLTLRNDLRQLQTALTDQNSQSQRATLRANLEQTEFKVEQTVDALQLMIDAAMQAQKQDELPALSSLKSEIQKTWISLKKAIAPEPAAKRKTPSPSTPVKAPAAKKTASKGVRVALTLILLTCGLGYGLWQWTAAQRQISTMSTDDLAGLSPYFQSAKRFSGDGQVNLTVTLNARWDSLDKTVQQAEMERWAEKLKAAGIHSAYLYTQQGKRLPVYFKGTFQKPPPDLIKPIPARDGDHQK